MRKEIVRAFHYYQLIKRIKTRIDLNFPTMVCFFFFFLEVGEVGQVGEDNIFYIHLLTASKWWGF